MVARPKILLVAAPRTAAGMQDHLRGAGYAVCGAVRCAADAVAAAADLRPDLALIELGLGAAGGEVSAIEAAGELGRRFDVPILFLVGDESAELLERTRAAAPFGYVHKSCAARLLRWQVDAALTRHGQPAQRKQEVHELHRELDQLRRRLALVEAVFHSVSEGLVVIDAQGNYLLHNPAMERIIGTYVPDAPFSRRSEIYGLYRADGVTLFPSDELPLARAVRGEESRDVELFVRNAHRPDGAYVSVSARPLYDRANENEPWGGVILFREVTQVKQVEAELRDTANRLQAQSDAMETIFDSISDGVVVADEHGKFTLFNPSAERMVGMGAIPSDPKEWSKRYGIFFPDRETPVPTDELPLMRAIRGEAVDEVTLFIRNANVPRGVFISVNGRPIRGRESGNLTGGVIVFRDITERMQTQRDLNAAFAQGRLDVVDTILHNVGNAINSVSIGIGTIFEELQSNGQLRLLVAVADALEEHRGDWITYLQEDPQGRKVLPLLVALASDFVSQNEALRQTAERVKNRVNHVVDIIRTERSIGNAASARKYVNLMQSLHDAVRVLSDTLTAKGIEVVVCGKCDPPEQVFILESRFHQMLVNLVKNAIEGIDERAGFLPSEGRADAPVVEVCCYPQDEFLVIDVADNGIGIEPSRLGQVFAPGYTTKRGGGGLGLHSAANYVIESGGSISALSEGIGMGTTMRVKMRLASITPA